MKLSRLFSSEAFKGERNYIKRQRRYEIARTVLYFGISLGVFIMGMVYTKTRMNLLTLVAVLGCLPACKSLISVIMFCRFKGCSDEAYERISPYSHNDFGLWDCVFTSYDKNYPTSHILVEDKSIVGFTESTGFDENGFKKHIQERLSADGIKDVTVKVFTDIDRYIDRIGKTRIEEGSEEDKGDKGLRERMVRTLKAVSL